MMPTIAGCSASSPSPFTASPTMPSEQCTRVQIAIFFSMRYELPLKLFSSGICRAMTSTRSIVGLFIAAPGSLQLDARLAHELGIALLVGDQVFHERGAIIHHHGLAERGEFFTDIRRRQP